MKKLLILLVVTIIGNVSIQAQKLDSLKFVEFRVNVHFADFDDFNQQSSALGYPALANEVANFTVVFSMKNGKWLNSTNLAFGMTTDNGADDSNGPSARFEYLGLGVSSAYNFFKQDSPWFLGPKLEFTFRGEQIVLSEERTPLGIQAASQTDFIKFNRFHIPIYGGLNFMRFFPVGKDKENIIVLNIEGGYSIDTGSDAWRIDQAVPVAENGINTAGLQIGFGLGFNFN